MRTHSPKNEQRAAEGRPWIEIELMQWFDDREPIRATDNRPAHRERPLTAAVTPLEPPEFKRAS